MSERKNEARADARASASSPGSDGYAAWLSWTKCGNPRHDHTTPVGLDGETLPAPVLLLCADCRQPSHYEDGAGYVHDAPDAPGCFLIPVRPDSASPCTLGAQSQDDKASQIADLILGNEEVDHLDALEVLRPPVLALPLWQEVAERLEVCPVHLRDEAICADDEADCAAGHRGEVPAVHGTSEFNMIWQNDEAVYRAVLAYARDLLRQVPGMTDQTLGRNVKDRVFSWAYGGGWGYSSGWGGATASLRDEDRYPDWADLTGPPAGYRPSPFSYFLARDAYGAVAEEDVAEDVLEALGIEDPS